MTDAEKIELLADMFEIETGDIQPEVTLDSLVWDSIRRITFIALVDEHFKKTVNGSALKDLDTVADLLEIMKPIN